MKTVVQINSVINKGSTGKICQEIGELTENNGWKHYIAYGRDSNQTDLTSYRVGNKLDNYSHAAKSILFDAQGLGSRQATINLCKWLDQVSPNVIHLHNLHGHYLNYPYLFRYLKQSNVPVLWTLHDCWSFTGHCTYYSDIECVKWKTKCYECPKRANYPKSLFLDFSTRNFEMKKGLFLGIKNLKLITVSNWLRQEVKQSFLGDQEIVTIHNGVDTSIFHPGYDVSVLDEKYGLKGKFVAVAAATAWSPTKGFSDYVSLSGLLKSNEVLVLIGLDEKTIAQLPPNMIGVRRTESQQELARWYNRADVVLNLSTQETFGMTTVEGFACGTPAIVYNSTASPELINEKVGYVLEPGDVCAVYTKIRELRLKNDSLGYDCVKHANENFNSDKQYSKYISIYESLL